MNTKLLNERLDEVKIRLNLLGLDDEMVVKPFLENGILKYSEYQNEMFNAILFDVDNDKELKKKIEEFEKENNAIVYHVQLTHFVFGDCYSFFYVSDYMEEWEDDRQKLKENCSMVYVWNRTDDFCSEFGWIGFKPSLGGVVRTA